MAVGRDQSLLGHAFEPPRQTPVERAEAIDPAVPRTEQQEPFVIGRRRVNPTAGRIAPDLLPVGCVQCRDGVSVYVGHEDLSGRYDRRAGPSGEPGLPGLFQVRRKPCVGNAAAGGIAPIGGPIVCGLGTAKVNLPINVSLLKLRAGLYFDHLVRRLEARLRGQGVHGVEHHPVAAGAGGRAEIQEAVGGQVADPARASGPGGWEFREGVDVEEIAPARLGVDVVAVGDSVPVAAVVTHRAVHLLGQRFDDLAGLRIVAVVIRRPDEARRQEDVGGLEMVEPCTGGPHLGAVGERIGREFLGVGRVDGVVGEHQ